MSRPKKIVEENQENFTAREVSAFLSNAVIAVRNPPLREVLCADGKTKRYYGGKIDEKKIQKLRNYTLAILSPLVEHVNEGFLSDEELVAVLVCGAQYLHKARILQTLTYETAPIVPELNL